MGLPPTCGPYGNESCCATTAVPGGAYNRSNDTKYPATVSDFRLDRFEITVGRFRAFVEAYPGSKPAAGAGEHPLIAGSGWDTAWDANLPGNKDTLKVAVNCDPTNHTWTDDVSGGHEDVPMNCVSWYEAFAFCAWDGGRLPTEAEWNYAAAGGGEQRNYPWGNLEPNPAYAVYDCMGDGSPAGNCAFTDILKVGSKPAGDGKWGQTDLVGSMAEWNLDWYADPYPTSTIPCDDCANMQSASYRVRRGGSWSGDASYLLSSLRGYDVPVFRHHGLGARCARTP
jgi:formylglycine-generating enzyme required for sulfatase activity